MSVFGNLCLFPSPFTDVTDEERIMDFSVPFSLLPIIYPLTYPLVSNPLDLVLSLLETMPSMGRDI